VAIDARLAIFVSAPKTENLSSQQRVFLAALAARIEAAGFRVLPDSPSSDDVEARLDHIRRCHGVVIFACSQWEATRLYRSRDKAVVMPSEFSHISIAMATAARRPLLVLREKTVSARGAIRPGYTPHIVNAPASLKPDWLGNEEFSREFQKWKEEVDCFRHVFLGYSSEASEPAAAVRRFLSDELKVRVFDWHEFRAGDSIWESIERAERLTNCGIFLFMNDDKLTAAGKRGLAPRDNVVYEAGYFAGAKGRKNSLIIREEGAKVPSDLGGILYVKLEDRGDISPLEASLRQWVMTVLDTRD
jgi:hypothetical protein